MYNKIFLSVLSAFIVTILIFHNAEAAVEPGTISVSVGNDIYYDGEHVVVFGQVGTIFEDMPITIQIYYQSSLIDVAQVIVAKDGTFVGTFPATGPLWNDDGTYTIRVFYTPTQIAEVTFDFFNQRIDKSSAVFPVNIPNSGTFDVGYTIRGGEVKNIEMDLERYSILVESPMDTNGNLILKLPRESFDAQSGGTDENFIVLVSKENTGVENFINVEYEEVATGSDYRTIRIPLEEGDKWVEVVGTYVIPEFGSIVIMILLVGTISAIIISKSRLAIRYN